MVIWQPEDKKWLKARKEAWRPVYQSLQESFYTPRSHIKPLREFFMIGKEPEYNPYEDKYIFLLHRLWFHPDQSEVNWQQLIEQVDIDDYVTSRQMFVDETKDPRLHVTEFGFMGGLEERMVEALFPQTNPKAEFLIKNKPLPVMPWSIDSFFMHWGLAISRWLTYHASNPYCIAQYLTEHMWNCLPFFDPNHLKKSGDRWLKELLLQCAYFVEPQGMKGEETPQWKFVQSFRQELNQHDLPDYIDQIWNQVQTRKQRSMWTAEMLDSNYGAVNDSGAYITYVIHSPQANPQLFQMLVETFTKLEFSDTEYNPDNISLVDLTGHLTPEMVMRLGYKKGDAIPSYRFKFEVNSDFVDSDNAIIAFDLIMLIPHPESKLNEETPIFLMLPRPAWPYDIDLALAYKLNVNMVRRVFEKEHGYRLLRYFDQKFRGKPMQFDKLDFYYQATYQPLINFRNAMVDTSEEDFPEWQGIPLPNLFR